MKMSKSKKIRSKVFWIILGALAVLLRILLEDHPGIVEQYYSRGFFLGIRWTIDYLFAWLPVPLIYLFFSVLFLIAFRKARRLIRSEVPLREKIFQFSLSSLSFLGGTVFAFFLLWGYNYNRLSIEEQLGLEPAPLSLEELRAELDTETENLLRLRSRIPGAGEAAIDAGALPEDLEKHLRRQVEGWLKTYGFPTTGRVRARRLYPKGIFLHFSSSGLYFPLTGEGHVDAGVHPLQLPFTMTHEMSHGFGFGDEGACNFIAYLSCTQSPDPMIAYAGHLNYWRTLASNYLRYRPETYRQFRDNLPAGIQADLDSINENLLRYPDIMPRLRYYAYDAYLKSQGIEEGILNYNRVIMLVRAWRKKKAG